MPGNPFTDPNWAPDLADTVERYVGKVRSTATDNAVKASRGVVFGTLALLALLTALPLFVILTTRLFETVLSRVTRTSHGATVYLAYLIVGALMFLLGFVALAFRRPKDAK